jgi:excisionase family DNA binding protein
MINSDNHLSGLRLISRKEMADRGGWCLDTVDALIRSGEVESIKVGKSRRIVEASFEAFVERKLAEARSPKIGRPTRGEVQRRAEQAGCAGQHCMRQTHERSPAG